MRSWMPVLFAGLAVALIAATPAPVARPELPATQSAWNTVCYNVYEPMWLPGIGWRLVLAKRCMNHLALDAIAEPHARTA